MKNKFFIILTLVCILFSSSNLLAQTITTLQNVPITLNRGTIKATNNPNSTAIFVSDANASSDLFILNPSTGLIDAGPNGKAIVIRGVGNASILNDGVINGSIDFGSSNSASIDNFGVINGSIDLGSGEGSSIITHGNNINPSAINGNIIFGNSEQSLSLESDVNRNGNAVGTSVSGAIIGSGSVSISKESVLNLNSAPDNSPILASINGAANVANSAVGFVSVNQGQSVSLARSVGNLNPLSNFNISSQSSASFLDDISLSAGQINLSGNLNLLGSNGNIVNGNINGSGVGSLSLNNANHTVNGNLNLVAGDTINTTILNQTQTGNITVNGVANVTDGVKLKVALPSDLINVGDSYAIVKGQNGSNLNQIVNNNINIANTGTNKIGILEFTTAVDETNNNLVLNVARLSEPEIVVISQDSSQPDFTTNIFNNVNNSLNISSARLSGLRGLASGDQLQNKSIWGQTFASDVSQGNSSSGEGYKAGAAGLIFGADHQFENDLTVGLSFSYSNSDIKSRSALKKIDVDSYQANLYSSYDFDRYFINGLVGIALNKYSSDRILNDRSAIASSNYSGNTYTARVEVGTNYQLINDLVLAPILLVSAAQNRVNNYSENGAGLSNLNVRNDYVNFFETRFGAELGKEVIISKTDKIRPKISASYGYDFAGDKQNATLNFVGQSASFQSSGGNVAKESLKLGTGIEIYHLSSFKFNFDYGFETKKSYQAHNGSLKVKYSF